ncbi:hypothetical protein J4209_02735 [Candidatus Woesearchaeota archaeon]|nr:hypothetical protein [Candidatus Woesearchaeota archaeon]
MRYASLIIHPGYSTDDSIEDVKTILANPEKYGSYSSYLERLERFLIRLRKEERKNFFTIQDGASKKLSSIFLPNEHSIMIVTKPTYEKGVMIVGARFGEEEIEAESQVVPRLRRALKRYDGIAVAGEYAWFDDGELAGSKSSKRLGCLGDFILEYLKDIPFVGIKGLVYPSRKPRRIEGDNGLIDKIYSKTIEPEIIFNH